MKKILVLLLFPALASAQVTLPDNVARFYFERHYMAKKLADQLVIKNNIITNLELQLDQKDAVVSSYVNDRALYEDLLKIKKDESDIIEKDLKQAYKEVTKQKLQKKFIIIGSIILIALAAR